MRRILFSLLLMFISTLSYATVQGKAMDYVVNGVTLKGYLAFDDAITEKQGAILVVHEWWGHNAYARKRADMLAALGYTALAVDMYGEGKSTEHPKEAKAFMNTFFENASEGKARFLAAIELLKQQKQVDSTKIAAVGYCFGGGVVLNMARSGVDLVGVASFHGSLSTKNPAQKGAVKAKILVLHGADDKMISTEQVDAFHKEMVSANVDVEFISYPATQHSFTNPDADKFQQKYGLPVAYNEKADKASWEKLQQFLTTVFNQK